MSRVEELNRTRREIGNKFSTGIATTEDIANFHYASAALSRAMQQPESYAQILRREQIRRTCTLPKKIGHYDLVIR